MIGTVAIGTGLSSQR